MGVSESIAVVVFIGFSVDYTVLLAMSYSRSTGGSSVRKMEQAYREVGSSILCSAITSLGAGAWLYGGVLVTSLKFAQLFLLTIATSFVVSMVFFGAMCQLIGPTGGTGDLCPKKYGTELARHQRMKRELEF